MKAKTPAMVFSLCLGASAVFAGLYFQQAKRVREPLPKKEITAAPTRSAVATRGNVQSYAQETALESGMIEIPKRFQLPGVSRVSGGKNFKEWMAQYPSDVQEKIRSFNDKFFGVYLINSPNQVAWMARNGYPMPEDLVAAEKLSNIDLRELASQGNEKALFLLRDRHVETIRSKLEANAASGKSVQQFWESDPDGPRLEQEDKADRKLLMQAWSSPFKGFVEARETLSIGANDPVNADAMVFAGLALAEYLGDTRASQYAQSYAQGNPTRMAIYTGIQRAQTNQISLMRAAADGGCTQQLNFSGSPIPWNGLRVQ